MILDFATEIFGLMLNILLSLSVHTQGSVCLSVKSYFTNGCLFVLKTLSRTLQAMKVKKICGDLPKTTVQELCHETRTKKPIC